MDSAPAASATSGASRQLRIGSALALTVCADRLGTPLQGVAYPTPAQIQDALPGAPALPDDRVSGQALLFARHLVEHGGVPDEENLVRALLRADMGSGSAGVLADIARGTPWREAAAAAHHGTGSYGSTAAVRAVAAGLLPAALTMIADTARRGAAVTHHHLLARDGAAVVAVAVSLALRGHPQGKVDPAHFLAVLSRHTCHPEFGHYLTVARTLVRHRAGTSETVATMPRQDGALRTVTSALVAFLRYHGDPEAALRYALALGGNTRAIAATTAALAGARNPRFTAPAAWACDLGTLDTASLARALDALGRTR